MKLRTVALGTAGATAILATAVLVATVPSAGADQHDACRRVDTSTEEVLPGVTLTWDSSFKCPDAAEAGRYAITVEVSGRSANTDTAVIEDLRLSHSTPRPGGAGPRATAQANGLPLHVAPGSSGSFDVTGDYTLVRTGEGAKANLHLRVEGAAATNAEPFQLGIIVALRGDGAIENGPGAPTGDRDEPADSPPPPWVREMLDRLPPFQRR